MNRPIRWRQAALLVITLLTGGVARGETARERDQQAWDQAVQRGLQFVREQGEDWIEMKGCASCHQVPSMLWSLHEGQRRGLFDEPQQLDEWSEWAFAWDNWDQSESPADQTEAAVKNVETISSLILGAGTSMSASQRQQFRELLVATQLEDGAWSANGQLPMQKRSPQESSEVTTMWAFIALAADDQPSAEVVASQRKAYERLQGFDPGKSAEWWVVRWLVARAMDAEDASRWLTGLVDRQQADGGWGWLLDEPSDAFGTGLVLYALGQTIETHPEAIRRARAYLRETQLEDGSWPVNSTLARHRDEVIPTSAHWGTAWACLGLMTHMTP